MGNPSSGTKVQTTMSLSRGRHRPSLSAGASLQVEKLEKLSSNEKLSSGTLSPRITEEQYIAAFLGEKKMKRRTQSSLRGSDDFTKGLELNGVALGVEERKPLSSVSFRGHRRVGSGNVTPKAAESPRAKGTCTVTPGVENAKIAASLFYSPTKLERSMSLSRVAHRVIPVAGGNPRPPTGVGKVVHPIKQDTLAEVKWQDSQSSLESRLQGVVVHRSETIPLEKKADDDNTSGEDSEVWPFPCVGSGTIPYLKGALPFSQENDENSNPETSAVPVTPVENHPHGILVSTADSRSNYEHLYFNAAYLPVKDIHPVCFKTSNKLHSEQATTVSMNPGHDLHGTSRSCLLPNVASTQQPCSSKFFKPNGPDAACESLHVELQSENLSSIHPENSDRSNHPDVIMSISNSSPERQGSIKFERQPSPVITSSVKQSLLDLSHKDIKEIMLPRTSIGKVTEAELTEAAVLSSLVCDNLPADPLLKLKECRHVGTDVSQGRDVKEVPFSRVGLRKTNGPDLSLRKSTSFEPGLEEKARIDLEKKTKLRKRRRSVSASGIGAMLLKVVRVSDSRPLDRLPMSEHKVSDAGPMQNNDQVPSLTTRLHQEAQVENEPNTIEIVDMDVEFEDCSTELVAPDTDAFHVEGSSDIKDAKRPLKEIELLLVDDTKLCKNIKYTEVGQSVSQENIDQTTESNLGRRLSNRRHTSLPRCGSYRLLSTSDAGSGSRNFKDNKHQKREISSEKILNCNFHPADDPREDPLLQESILDARDKVQDCDLYKKESNSRSGRTGACLEEKVINQENLNANARLNDHRVNIREDLGGIRRRRPGSKGRISLDMDSSTECQSKKLADMAEAKSEIEHAQTITYHRNKPPLSLLDENACCMTPTQKQPRSVAFMLQVTPLKQPLDDHRLAPSSIFILANPSFSSSQQDRLWEEQAEAYSSGGRGTPGREDDAALAVNVYLHSPSPGGAMSSDDHVHSTAASLRKSQEREMSTRSCSGFVSDNGCSHDRRKLVGQAGKKRGRPRTPLRTLLAEDLHGKTPASGFLQHIFSRIRGSSTSSKSSSPKSSQSMPKRRHSALWSSCLCFSYVK